jgi:hypothetical protein
MQYLVFGISISFISWMFGMIVNSFIKDQAYYNKLSNLNFLTNEKYNKVIGLELLSWIVKNTFFKFFNQSLKLDNTAEISALKNLRKEMTIAEISHLIAFIFVLFFAVYKGISQNFVFGLVVVGINILMNLYPSLLQQKNKRRIDRLIKISVKRKQRS